MPTMTTTSDVCAGQIDPLPVPPEAVLRSTTVAHPNWPLPILAHVALDRGDLSHARAAIGLAGLSRPTAHDGALAWAVGRLAEAEGDLVASASCYRLVIEAAHHNDDPASVVELAADAFRVLSRTGIPAHDRLVRCLAWQVEEAVLRIGSANLQAHAVRLYGLRTDDPVVLAESSRLLAGVERRVDAAAAKGEAALAWLRCGDALTGRAWLDAATVELAMLGAPARAEAARRDAAPLLVAPSLAA